MLGGPLERSGFPPPAGSFTPPRCGLFLLRRSHDVHPNLITNWKKQAQQQVLAGFSGNHERHEASRETEIKELRAKIGELVIERDFLSKAFGR